MAAEPRGLESRRRLIVIAWGVVGAGSVAQRRTIPAILKARGMRLAALMVRDLGRAQQLAARFGAPAYYDTVEGVLQDSAVNAVYIATPVYLHCQHVLASAKYGKHVLCEKPMAMDVGQCQRMIDACRANNVHLEICFVLRHWPIYKHVKQTIESGKLGEVVEIRGHVAKWKPRRDEEWRTDPRKAGGGSLMDVGSHYLDLFRYLLGEYEAISYMGGSPVFGWEVEESAFVMLRFSSGAHGLLTVSSAVPYTCYSIEVYGTKGTMLLGDTLELITPAGTSKEPADYPDYYDDLLEHFRQCVEEGRQPVCTPQDGLRNIQTITAAYRCAKSGRTQPL